MEIYGRNGQTLTERWKDGAETLHGWTTSGFPNCYIIGITQIGLTPSVPHVVSAQAEHLAYVIATCRDRGIRTAEATTKAEHKWVELHLETGKPRAAYLKDCTPGYYNNEGTGSLKASKNGQFGGGSVMFMNILKEWREKGDLEGLNVTKFETKEQSQL
jgi:hypothetical protein